jgi:prolipoprotein diacylglyceryl transferase
MRTKARQLSFRDYENGVPLLAFIPSPHRNGFDVGAVFVHYYPLCMIVAVAVAIAITRRRWRAQGGDPRLVEEMALYGVPGGIIGGRLYHDVTSWNQVPHTLWGWAEVWKGGTGAWGMIAGGAAVIVLVLHRRGLDIPRFADAIAPGLLVAMAIGRLGNYANQELFGGPSTVPWAVRIDLAHRPPGYSQFATFQPTGFYEAIWNLALAAALVWLGHHRRVRAPGLFALAVTGYCAFRIFEETLRIDPANHLLGLRVNLYVAAIGTLAGLTWFRHSRRQPW